MTLLRARYAGVALSLLCAVRAGAADRFPTRGCESGLLDVPDADTAIALAKKYEHGFKHTAIIHSRNVETITRMGRAMDTTLFVQNGPSTAGLGSGGEGYLSFSIATPTGEGVTTPLTFTRQRRSTTVNALRVL